MIILRGRAKDLDRPYRVTGYPWVPGAFVLFAAVFLVMTLWTDITNYLEGRTLLIDSLLGVAIVALGIPVRWLVKRHRS